MKSFLESINKLPKYVKIILALPILDIIWIVYRVGLSMEKDNKTNVLLAVVAGIVTLPILWLIDILTLCIYDKVLWID